MSGQKDDRAKVEQILGECFVKAANIVLSSRISHTTPPRNAARPNQRHWPNHYGVLQFNLKLEELGDAQPALHGWKKEFSSPLILEILGTEAKQDAPGSESQEAQSSTSAAAEGGEGVVLERWTLQCQRDGKGQPRAHSSRTEVSSVYKRLVMVLRSLYVFVRILPAFRTYRNGKRKEPVQCRLRYNISRGAVGESRGKSQAGSDQMRHFTFAAAETPSGNFQMSVEYHTCHPMLVAEQPGASPGASAAAPHIIPDYVATQKPVRSSLSESLYTSNTTAPEVKCAVTMQPTATEGASTLGTSPVMLRRHSWSLNSARSQVLTQKLQPEPRPQQGTPGRPGGAHPPTPYSTAQARSPAPSPPFAPGTPTAAATPPKYPSQGQGLATRMSQAAVDAASRMYNMSRSPSVFTRSPSSSSGRASPARFREMEEVRRGSRAASPAPPSSLQQGQAAEQKAAAPAGQSRTPSKPVGIPGCQGNARKLRSSGDLYHLDEASIPIRSTARKTVSSKVTASAPAGPIHFGFSPTSQAGQPGEPKPAATRPGPTPFESVAKGERGGQPGTPPTLYKLPSISSESGSSVFSSAPAAGSPQLPFAFTPSTNSYSEMQRRESSGVMPAVSSKLPRPVTGVQRSSWGNMSSGLETSLSTGTNVGYSVSPMLDSLGSSLFESSTPHHALPFSLHSQTSSPLAQHQPPGQEGVVGSVQGEGFTRLVSADAALMALDESDAEGLPFALDQEPGLSIAAPRPLDPAAADPLLAQSQDSESESDAHVGAFVQLMSNAGPLNRSSQSIQAPGGALTAAPGFQGMTLDAGLDQIAQLRMRLTQLSPRSNAS